MRILALGILASLLLLSTASAQKKAKPTYRLNPGVTNIAEEVAKHYVAAEKPCDNYGWGATVEMLFLQKQIPISQQDWVLKAYGGPLCISPLAVSDYAGLLRYISGDYAVTPERKVHVEATFTPGAPIQPDSFIAAFRAGDALMLVWNGKPYVWYGVVYDEYIHPVGNRLFELRELKLLDPLAKTKETQMVSFIKGKDDANQIDGVMRITVTPRDR